ncbi:hypothetical protein CP98_03879 [Sphingobium yanoikuyae]|uniref:Sulfotransferase n=1 Tax=Sphingobium yanoikuyae TaxID=13690 RepID=A0A084EG15_SPHYA|nr:sulfotransferase [Sphingobium yanoikuyae]KEZ16907.1 hypothetical protein CP98_03879 [Sphingobium yanoikuyae]
MLDGPIAIGGIGGSGTRVVAAFLQKMGRYIGTDLNEPLDNLWFTLLFKRQSILLESNHDFTALCWQFWARMAGTPSAVDDISGRLAALSTRARPQHSITWLQARARSWLETESISQPIWGWKEPNTHIVIDRMLGFCDDLRYIHVVRNPLDMALSKNQNQLVNWGAILLDRPIEPGPRDSLSYACAVARRIDRLAALHAGRICLIDFDQLCRTPELSARQIVDFIGTPVDQEMLSWFSALIGTGRPQIGRYRKVEHGIFTSDDLEFVESLGYAIG